MRRSSNRRVYHRGACADSRLRVAAPRRTAARGRLRVRGRAGRRGRVRCGRREPPAEYVAPAWRGLRRRSAAAELRPGFDDGRARRRHHRRRRRRRFSEAARRRGRGAHAAAAVRPHPRGADRRRAAHGRARGGATSSAPWCNSRHAREDEVAWYVARGAARQGRRLRIQGLASRFVTRIDGSYSNVVGPAGRAWSRLSRLADVRLAAEQSSTWRRFWHILIVDRPGTGSILSIDSTMTAIVQVGHRPPRVLVLAFSGLLLVHAAARATEYYKHVDEVMVSPEQWYGKQLQLHGFVVPDSICGSATRSTTGSRSEQRRRRRGHLHGIVPDTFKDEAEVVLKGTLSPDGFTVDPNGIMAKCPSKYERSRSTGARPASVRHGHATA